MLESVSVFLVSIGVNPTHLTAGLAGSLVRSLLTKGKSRREILSGGFVGTACAMYLTPIAVDWLHLEITQVSSTNAIAFAIGITGMSLAEGAVRAAQRWAVNPKLPRTPDLAGLADAINPDKKPDDLKGRLNWVTDYS